MIAPHIRVVDVEPDGFGIVCSLAAAAGGSGSGELHVLHDRGRVLRVVHTISGASADFWQPLGPDLPSAAAQLRDRAGVDRVILVDREQISSWGHALAQAGAPDVDQSTAFRRTRAVFWTCPGVVADPPPRRDTDSWDRLAEHLQSLGPDYWTLLAGYDGPRCAFTLLARLVEGQIVHLTSLAPLLGDKRPARDNASELVKAAERLGSVPLVLVADLWLLQEVLSAPDLPIALFACTPQALITRGLST